MRLAFAIALALSPVAQDPRLDVVQLQVEARTQEALTLAETLLEENPEAVRPLGFDFLRGYLLAEMGRSEESQEAFGRALEQAPEIYPYSRYFLALQQERIRHPEVAAGLVSTLLRDGAPRHLVPDAVALLDRTLRKGGDCRVLLGVPLATLPPEARRRLQFRQAVCRHRQGAPEEAGKLFLALLEERTTDEVAKDAAEWVAAFGPGKTRPEVLLLIGRTLHHNREFERAIHYLHMALNNPAAQVGTFDDRYNLVRAEYWLGRHSRAAAGYADLASSTRVPEDRARTLFQRGRCLELLARFKEASNAFRLAYNAEPTGSWAAASLLAALRLEWRTGNEEAALHLYQLLTSRHQWKDMASRAALFLAASDLVQGRWERVAPWLDQARRAGRSARPEVEYWQGRQAELAQQHGEAVSRYLEVLRHDPFHPLALDARQRLKGSPALAGATEARAQRLAASGQVEDLHLAWILLRDLPQGQVVRKRLLQLLLQDANAAPYLRMAPVPVEEWPLWRTSLKRPEEMLLALGVWSAGAPLIGRHFPVSDPSLALTGSQLLLAGGEDRPSLLHVEILSQRVPQQIPFDLLPLDYRRLLYPSTHRELIAHHALRFEVDPHLLSAIIREESRFEVDALSVASARGLTQFVLPTARRLAVKAGLKEGIHPTDLYEPATAVALGATYLGELLEGFHGAEHQVVAAYNAGEPQARLWRAYSFSNEFAEYFTKVGFYETRNYLRKVLTSRAHYRDLYGDPSPRLPVYVAGTPD
jgi:soluble lytic murein transglycosylase